MIKDLSIHFTIKDQKLSEIQKKLFDYLESNPNIMDEKTFIHHCFLPREIVEQKEFSTDVVDFLDDLSGEQVIWFTTMDQLEERRNLMFKTLAKDQGTALFIGDIKAGVKIEHDMAKEAGLGIIHIE